MKYHITIDIEVEFLHDDPTISEIKEEWNKLAKSSINQQYYLPNQMRYIVRKEVISSVEEMK